MSLIRTSLRCLETDISYVVVSPRARCTELAVVVIQNATQPCKVFFAVEGSWVAQHTGTQMKPRKQALPSQAPLRFSCGDGCFAWGGALLLFSRTECRSGTYERHALFPEAQST